MKISDLETGTKLELEILDDKEHNRFKKAVSMLQIVKGESLLIDAPIYGSVVYPIHIGTTLNVYFSNRTDKQIDVCRFRAKVTGRENTGNLSLLQIEAESRIQMVQRRQFYRLECSLTLKYRQVAVMDTKACKDIDFKATLIRNLSGGGLCIYAEENVDIGEILECELYLKEDEAIRFYGTVVRFEDNDFESKYKYLVGIAFKKIDNKDREAVIKFIFEQQRKYRKRGLI